MMLNGTFTTDAISTENSRIVPMGGYTTKNNFGQLASLIGKNIIIFGYNIDSGTFGTLYYHLKSFGTINTDNINLSTINSRDYNYVIISNDVMINIFTHTIRIYVITSCILLLIYLCLLPVNLKNSTH